MGRCRKAPPFSFRLLTQRLTAPARKGGRRVNQTREPALDRPALSTAAWLDQTLQRRRALQSPWLPAWALRPCRPSSTRRPPPSPCRVLQSQRSASPARSPPCGLQNRQHPRHRQYWAALPARSNRYVRSNLLAAVLDRSCPVPRHRMRSPGSGPSNPQPRHLLPAVIAQHRHSAPSILRCPMLPPRDRSSVQAMTIFSAVGA